MAGLWASPNKLAFCSLVWRSLSSEALLPAGLVMSWRHIIKDTSVQLSEALQPTYSLLPYTEHARTSQKLLVCVCGCVFLKDLIIWHQLIHPTSVKILHQTHSCTSVCLTGNHQLNLLRLFRKSFDVFPQRLSWSYLEAKIGMLFRGKRIRFSVHTCALKFRYSSCIWEITHWTIFINLTGNAQYQFICKLFSLWVYELFYNILSFPFFSFTFLFKLLVLISLQSKNLK